VADPALRAAVPRDPTWRWMTGFECTAFPQVGMDELELTQHDRFWGSDLLLAARAGCTAVRYGIRWHVVNPSPREWDWTSVDGPLQLMRDLDLEPIVDLFHFGVPTWLDEGVMTPIFPDFQAELARRFARRYPWVRWYTPTNEPYIMSQFGGESAAWFPYRRGPRNFAIAARNVVRGLCEAWHEIVAERPDARLMISDTCEYHHPLDDGPAAAQAALFNERRFLVHELYGGRVTREHALWGWLVEHGMALEDLEWFVEHPAPLDVVGLDYYPHSEHQWRSGEGGRVIDETRPLDRQLGPAELVRQYHARLGRPLLFAETGAPGDDATKVAWLSRLVDGARAVRAEGVPLIGITWWGLIDQVDWGHGLRRFRHDIDPTGLYALRWRDGRWRETEAPDDPATGSRVRRLERVPTGALDAWTRLSGTPADETVGRLEARDGGLLWDDAGADGADGADGA
jgi:beta-glucosidase/6-phospho-beta-glucosidase/beta-galactosidase